MPRQRLSRLSRSIEGRVALVTGAASGMGRATAHLLADEGAKVAVVDRDEPGAAEVSDSIRGAGGTAEAFTVDLSDLDAVEPLVHEVRTKLGPIDILVNNAGVSIPTAVTSDTWRDSWERTMTVNLAAHAELVRMCLDDLRRNGDGRVVNIASTAALGAASNMTPYVVSKHGVVGLTRSLAVELGRTGVTVNCVCPGAIDTAMTADTDDADKRAFARARIPMRRYGDPEEVAHVTLAMVLPSASYLNGACVTVDGGMTLRH